MSFTTISTTIFMKFVPGGVGSNGSWRRRGKRRKMPGVVGSNRSWGRRRGGFLSNGSGRGGGSER